MVDFAVQWCIRLHSQGTLIVITILLVAMGFAQGCGRTPAASVASDSSVSALLDKMPNLRPFDVQSCNYTIEKSSGRGGVPSPSDTMVEVKGSATVSEEGWQAMLSNYTWKVVAREQMRPGLRTIVPPGETWVSDKLNDSFLENPTYAHGFVSRLRDESERKIYFLVRDLDHPIE